MPYTTIDDCGTRAGYRLLATSVTAKKGNANQVETFDAAKVMMSTVAHHLKQHGLKAEFTDDDEDMLVCKGSMAQVLMGLSGLGWGHGEEEPVVGGLYCSGVSVTVHALQPLRLMQTSIDRVTVTLQRQQTQAPEQAPAPEPVEGFAGESEVPVDEDEHKEDMSTPQLDGESHRDMRSDHNVNTVTQPNIPVQASEDCDEFLDDDEDDNDEA